MVKDRRFYPLVLLVLFILSVSISVFICKMVITETSYTPDVPTLESGQLSENVTAVAKSLRSSAVQVMVLYLAGFSSLALLIGVFVLTYRGICFGYTVAALSQGKLILGDSSGGILSALGLNMTYVLPTLYLLATAAVAFMGYLSVSGSYVLLNGGDSAVPYRLKYTLAFAVLGGAVFLIDFLKLIVI